MKFPWKSQPAPAAATAVKAAAARTAPAPSRTADAEAPAPEARRSQVFVSRTPLLTRERLVSAYELHFHSSPSQESSARLSDYTSARVISDGILQIGLDTLASGRKVFVTVSRRLLLGGIPDLLPPHRVIIQLSGDIEAEADVIEACQALRKSGYAIAVDDFTVNEWTHDLVPLAMYLKVDWRTTAPETRAAILARRNNKIPAIIAKGVETEEAFQRARAEGFTFFQGPFFGLPSTSSAQTISGRQVTILRLLRALQDPDISVVALEDLVKQEPALTYRLLRTVNSAGFGQHRTVDSIRHALVLLGLNTIRRWAMLWAIAGLSADARSELMTMATIRARCCELLAERLDGAGTGGEGFLVGMCSLFEAILGCPLTDVLDHLALSDSARAALLGEDTPMKRRLDCVSAYERGAWDDCHRLAEAAGVDVDLVSVCYGDAMRWANQLDLTNDRS
jgi:EAL and modified HD-GYP domain-containing signal transduction protein